MSVYTEASYFNWLRDQVDTDSVAESYDNLLRSLYGVYFDPKLEFDSNRARDGMALRDDFVDETHIHIRGSELVVAPCTMFEVTLGLAKRVAWQLDGYTSNSVADWFWILLGNTGLYNYNDYNWDRHPEEYSRGFRSIVQSINNRTFEPSGMGGFFPLHSPTRDQRSIEMWAQMSDWCMEQTNM